MMHLLGKRLVLFFFVDAKRVLLYHQQFVSDSVLRCLKSADIRIGALETALIYDINFI